MAKARGTVKMGAAILSRAARGCMTPRAGLEKGHKGHERQSHKTCWMHLPGKELGHRDGSWDMAECRDEAYPGARCDQKIARCGNPEGKDLKVGWIMSPL